MKASERRRGGEKFLFQVDTTYSDYEWGTRRMQSCQSGGKIERNGSNTSATKSTKTLLVYTGWQGNFVTGHKDVGGIPLPAVTLLDKPFRS